jgi:hypothetical protein
MKQIIPIILLLIICVFLLLNVNTYVETFVNVKDTVNLRCGVGLSCPDKMRCVNGYCKTQNKPKLPYYTGLPINP